MDIDRARQIIQQYLEGLERPDEKDFNEALHTLLLVVSSICDKAPLTITPTTRFDDVIPTTVNNKIELNSAPCTCEYCKKVITDGKIFRSNGNPSKGICFDCY